MKKEAIEKVTSKLNPMVSDDSASLERENDDEMIRRALWHKRLIIIPILSSEHDVKLSG